MVNFLEVTKVRKDSISLLIFFYVVYVKCDIDKRISCFRQENTKAY